LDYLTIETRGLLCAGQALDEVGHPANLLPTPRQCLSSETQIWLNNLECLLCCDNLSANHLPWIKNRQM